MTNSSRYFDE